MICPECKVDRKQEDFFGKDRCYKCIYAQKTNTTPKKSYVCLMCGKDRPSHRDKYCDEECAYQAGKIKKDNHWSKNFLRKN